MRLRLPIISHGLGPGGDFSTSFRGNKTRLKRRARVARQTKVRTWEVETSSISVTGNGD